MAVRERRGQSEHYVQKIIDLQTRNISVVADEVIFRICVPMFDIAFLEVNWPNILV